MSGIAKRCSQMLSLKPGAKIALADAGSELSVALASLFGSVGAEVVEGDADAGVLELDEPLLHQVPAVARELVQRIAHGGTVVVVLDAVDADAHPNKVAAHVGPMLDLEAVAVQPSSDGRGLILMGTRRKKLDSKKIKRLRGLGHDIEPSVLVGRAGLSEETVAAARAAVERHGLVKVKLTPQCELDKGAAAKDVAWGTGSQLVQRIGKTALIYRPDVKLDPPVSRRRR